MAIYTHLLGNIANGVATCFSPFPRASDWILDPLIPLTPTEGHFTATDLPGQGGRTYKIVAYGTWADDGAGHLYLVGITSVYRYFGGQLVDQITDIQPSDDLSLILESADTFNGSSGRDAMDGGSGNDLLFGLGGRDVLDGGDGADTIYGGGGNDIINGGRYFDGTLGDRVYGGSGNDTVEGSPGDDSIYGGSGNDVLRGGGGGHLPSGDDRLDGGTGADSMDGGNGNDIYFVDDLGDRVLDSGVGPEGGWDVVFTSVSFDLHTYPLGFIEVEVVDARSATAGVTIYGNEYTAILRGGDHDDVLFANQQETAAQIGASLNGRGGADTMYGSFYDDTYFVDSSDDVVIDLFIDGAVGLRDTVYTSASYSLGAGQRIERLFADAGSVGLALTGNEFANLVRGASGNDTIGGGAGHDTLVGGSGEDTFELLRLAADWDRISDFAHGVDLIALSESRFGELDGPTLAFSERFLANSDGSTSNGGNGDTRVIYDTSTGFLFFDPDGTGSRGASLIAVLNGSPVLDYADFVIN